MFRFGEVCVSSQLSRDVHRVTKPVPEARGPAGKSTGGPAFRHACSSPATPTTGQPDRSYPPVGIVRGNVSRFTTMGMGRRGTWCRLTASPHAFEWSYRE